MIRKSTRRDVPNGHALVTVLSILVVVLMLGLAGARSALLGEKASRNDRDRQQAFRAAEAALLDAEADILRPASEPRREALARGELPGLGAGECVRGPGHPLQGLCRAASSGVPLPSQQVGIPDHPSADAGVSYGRFTARAFPHAQGPLPIQPPRYIIELSSGDRTRTRGRLYRITAIGHGARTTTQVALQSWYRVRADASAGVREAWREITDWRSNAQDEH